MLWLGVRVGGYVRVGNSKLVLLAKNANNVVVEVDGHKHTILRGSYVRFDGFTVHTGDPGKSLRLGFDAPKDINIVRGECETQFPAK